MDIPLPVALAVLGGALLHAGWNALLKSSAETDLATGAVAIASGLVALIVLPFLAAPASASWPWLAGSAALHVLYFAFLAGAYRWGELSYAYPLMRGGGPMLVALVGALLLEEVLAPAQAAGVALISLGIISLSAGRQPARATAFALANAAVIAGYTLIDAQGARASGAPFGYTAWFFVANGLIIGSLAFARYGEALPRFLLRHWRLYLAGGAAAFGSYAIALWAMTRAPVALVAALRETSVIFAAVLGVLFLGERFTRRRLIATAAVLAGLVSLRL